MVKSIRLGFTLLGICIGIINAATISGTVTDSISGEPVNSVRVSLRSGFQTRANDTTNNLGAFVFENVDTGSYTLRTTMDGYSSKSVSVSVSGTTPVTASISIVKIVTSTISGKVTDSTSGEAVSGAIVRLGNNTLDTTGTDGLYSFQNVTTGNQTIRVSMSGYVSKTATATVSGATPVTLNIALVKLVTTTVSGKVTDSTSGEAVSGAIVRLGNNTLDTTGTDGLYSFQNVTTGNQTIRVSMTGYVSKTATAAVSGATPVTLNIAIVKLVTTTVSGKVTDSTSGDPLSGAIVRLGNNTYDTTGSDGMYSFANVPSGNQSIRASMTGYATKTVSAPVTGTEPVSLNISLVKLVTTTLSGKVTDSISGAAISGAIVRVGFNGGLRDTSGTDGTYSISNVTTGTQMVSVSCTGYASKTSTATIAGSTPVTLNFALTVVVTATVSGVVTDSTTGAKIAKAVVRIGTGMSNLYDTTDNNGAYSIANVSSGTQSIRVSISGYNTKTVSVTISNSNPVTQNIALTKRTLAVLPETVKPGIPYFSISNGIVNMANIKAGKLTIFGLNGKVLYQYSFEPGHAQIALPELFTTAYIATITTEGKTLTRTIIPVRD